MKVRIVITLDVDPERWIAEFACSRDEVREDVRDWVTSQLSNSYLGEDGTIREVTVS